MLMNKWNLAIVSMASTEPSRYNLEGVSIEPGYTVATDGRRLIVVSTPEIKEDSFPAVPDFTPAVEFKPFVVPAKVAKEVAGKIPKGREISVLNHVQVGNITDAGQQLAVAGLNSTSIVKTNAATAFPEWRKIIEFRKKETLEITFDLNILSPVLELMRRFASEGGARDVPAPVTLRFSGKDGEVRADAQSITGQAMGQTMTAVVMPLVKSVVSKAKF